jgi:hypothetical protein
LLVERARLIFAASRWVAEWSMASVDLPLFVLSRVRRSEAL